MEIIQLNYAKQTVQLDGNMRKSKNVLLPAHKQIVMVMPDMAIHKLMSV